MAVRARELANLSTALLYFFFCVFGVDADIVVATNDGKLQGRFQRINTQPVHSFLGIPYASPPLGNLRFRSPRKVQAWSGLRDARRLMPTCLSGSGAVQTPLYTPDDLSASEDCLYLNVFTPSVPNEKVVGIVTEVDRLLFGSSPFAVVVYFQSSPVRQFKPIHLTASQKIVVVTVSYRLGVFGYLCLGEAANLALQDQRVALQWVQRNIASFNGDPRRVTVLGHGASAVELGLLLLSEGDALYHRAWLQSGTALAPHAIAKHPHQAVAQLAESTNCSMETDAAILECLQKLDASVLLNRPPGDNVWRPCVSGSLVPRNPMGSYQVNAWDRKVNLVIGFPQLDQYRKLASELLEDTLISNLEAELAASEVFSAGSRSRIANNITGLYIKDEDVNSYLFSDWAPLDMAFHESMSDLHTVAPSVKMADYHSLTGSANNGSVYMYEFLYQWSLAAKERPQYVQAVHGDDLYAVLGVPCQKDTGDWTDADCATSSELMSRLANFARQGNPNSHMSVHLWPKYLACNSHSARCIRNVVSVRNAAFSSIQKDYKQEKMDFWLKELFGNTLPVILPFENSFDQGTAARVAPDRATLLSPSHDTPSPSSGLPLAAEKTGALNANVASTDSQDTQTRSQKDEL